MNESVVAANYGWPGARGIDGAALVQIGELMARWSNTLANELDARAVIIETHLGPVQVARDGSGSQVFVIHGGPGGFDQGLMYGRHLRDHGCELIAPSRPGYLRTPLASGRAPAEQADLYVAILDALEIDRISVLGYSSGGPSAVHFAARHPDRVRSLILDSSVLQRYETPGNVVERFMVFSTFGAWCWHAVGQRWPKLGTNLFIDGFSTDFDKDQKRATAEWILADPARVELVQELWTSFAPWRLRRAGFGNDEHNESDLAPLPFAQVACPTVIAHGLHDGAVPVEHARQASEQVTGAELVLVDEGTHLLPVARHFETAMERRLELVLTAD